jgi:putative chitobiose transport system permease protein
MSLEKKKKLMAYLFLLPGMIVLVVFTFYPIIYGIPLAFSNYSIVGETKFIGLKNFTRAIHDPSFHIAIRNSLLYVIIVPFIQIISLLLAILVNRKIRGIYIFRAMYFIPVVTSMVAVAITWSWLFEENGLVNNILINLGILKNPVAWLTTPSTALGAVMFVTMWKGLGYYMMIYLAGLQSIPKEMEEAALVDGANRFQKVWHVVMPLMKPYILFCTLISIMAAIRAFDEVYVLTEGGPGEATLVTSLYVYKTAFENFDFGYASAVGLIVGVFISIFSILVFKFGKKGGMTYY